MKLAVASGKGGTGKTTVSCALALSVRGPVCLIDCDVEEPNSHFFIQPEIEDKKTVCLPVPQVDKDKCNGCGECGRICRFSAIAVPGKKAMVFNELCHSCGGCSLICQKNAIIETKNPIGTIEEGQRENIHFISGRIDVGQAMAPPVIRAVLQHAPEDGLTIIDCPPGTSCPFVTAVRECDAVLLVTEPTPFGLHDLQLAIETLRELGIPFAVLANRIDREQNRISEYCKAEAIPLLFQIPEDRRIAEAYSRGEPLPDAVPELKSRLAALPGLMEALL